MITKERIRFLGVGCCGSKEAKEFLNMGYKANAINGSEQDLKALGDMPKYKLHGFDGFGGHREKAIDCLKANGDFLNFIEKIEEDIIFVLFGGGGSTGSGCGTIIAELLLEDTDDRGGAKRIVCPVISLPSADEAIIKHRNAYQAVQELQDISGLGATFFINNDVNREYDQINHTFARLLDTFLTNDAYSERNNFDESERIEMLQDSGAMVLSFGKKDTESIRMLERLSRNGIFAPIEENKYCEHIGILHAENDEKDIDKSEIIAEVGRPENVFEGYNLGNGTLLAASGLDYPITHVSKLGALAQSSCEERRRNKKRVGQKLGDLFLEENENEKKPVAAKKSMTKLDLLKKQMQK